MTVPMVEITAKMVAELRARTGAGMMDCKKALTEAGGDLDKAVELLRQKGQAKSDKRAGREASEGTVAAYVRPDGQVGALVELNSETDFVARTAEFAALARDIARQLAESPEGADVTTRFGGAVKDLAAKTGENVTLRRTARLARTGSGRLETYVHFNGQVGVLLDLTTPAAAAGRPDVAELAKDLTLHIASAKPIAVKTTDVPADVVERERRVFTAQVAEEGKPEAVRGKIVEGKIRKFFEERVLLEQPFVKDDKKKIRDLLGEFTVAQFARFEVGGE